MGIEVREHREIDASHLLREGLVGKNRVNAHAQDLSVFGLEALAIGLEVRKLLLSAAGKIQGIKGEDHILFSGIIFESDFLLP